MSDQTSDLYLSSKQRDLLVAALSSNQPTSTRANMPSGTAEAKNTETPTGTSAASMPGSGRLDLSDESPFLDYPLDGEGDDSFNFDGEGRMFDDLPEDDEAVDVVADAYEHLHDKRKSIDGADEDDTGGGKRREGEDKTAKKPGRKPLTSEPTTVGHTPVSAKVILTIPRNAKRRTVLPSEPSENEKRSISKT